jgi:hypothetical protein
LYYDARTHEHQVRAERIGISDQDHHSNRL